MKVLVATKEGQGERRNDFCWAEEGELVIFASECDGERVDGPCGCRRSMSGLVSLKATTTVKVVEAPDDGGAALETLIREGLQKNWGFAPLEAKKEARLDMVELLRLAGRFPVGSVLEKRGDALQTRALAK